MGLPRSGFWILGWESAARSHQEHEYANTASYKNRFFPTPMFEVLLLKKKLLCFVSDAALKTQNPCSTRFFRPSEGAPCACGGDKNVARSSWGSASQRRRIDGRERGWSGRGWMMFTDLSKGVEFLVYRMSGFLLPF